MPKKRSPARRASPARGASKARAPSGTKVVVFLGPSMKVEEARAIYPDAEYRPPIRRGDLEVLEDGTIVGMIDGVFDQDLSISPREIRNALARGMSILGSSSMGALRAAEVRGVVGVGKVFEMYRDGRIDRDDEVALLFDPDSHRPITEPLVNIRYATEGLARAGTIDQGIAQRILDAALALHYRDRSYPAILRQAGLGERSDTPRLIELLRSLDLKRQDAHLLLERMPSFVAERSGQSGAVGKVHHGPEMDDHFKGVQVKGTYAADAPLLVWEYGDRLPFVELVHFLKLTNRFLPHARNAISRFLLQGNELSVSMPRRAPALPTPQQLLQRLQGEWGWTTSEEATVTLADLGMGLDDIAERIHEEVSARQTITALALRQERAFLKALRSELVLNNLALKREALRLGAVRTLASAGREGRPLEPDERIAAQRVLAKLFHRPRWSGVLLELARVGVGEEVAQAFVEELAYARRASQTLVQAFRAGWGPREERPAPKPAFHPEGLPLKPSPKAPGSLRFSLSMQEAEAAAQKIAASIGVTRVGQIGELDELGVHIAQAFRPGSPWSSTVGGGKGDSPVGARVGSIMEEGEKFAQEQYPREREEVVSTYAELRQRHPTLDPRTLHLPYDSRYHEELELAWIPCLDLLSGQRLYTPLALWTIERTRNDILYSPRGGRKLLDTNGLASGFSLEEALAHATAELIERHATRLSDLHIENPGEVGTTRYRFIDPQTLPPSVRHLTNRFAQAGFESRILEITSEIRVPTFEARLVRDVLNDPGDAPNPIYPGWAAHPNPEMAMVMALLEAAQTKAGNIAGAREDLSIKARSLGRHERPRPVIESGATFWYRSDDPRKPFSAIEGFVSNDLREDVLWILDRVREAGCEHVLFVDYTIPEIAPAHAVRVVIPGLEGTNPFYTGPRARVAAIRDLVG